MKKADKREKEKEKEKANEPAARFSGYWDRERDLASKNMTRSEVTSYITKNSDWSTRFKSGGT